MLGCKDKGAGKVKRLIATPIPGEKPHSLPGRVKGTHAGNLAVGDEIGEFFGRAETARALPGRIDTHGQGGGLGKTRRVKSQSEPVGRARLLGCVDGCQSRIAPVHFGHNAKLVTASMIEAEAVRRLGSQQQSQVAGHIAVLPANGAGRAIESAQGKIGRLKGEGGAKQIPFSGHVDTQRFVGLHQPDEAEAKFLDSQLESVAFPLAEACTLRQGLGRACHRTGKGGVRRDLHQDTQIVRHIASPDKVSTKYRVVNYVLISPISMAIAIQQAQRAKDRPALQNSSPSFETD
ncbi:MAG TPA: hypothetical protein PKC79_03370 [Solidesulfovibrio magneticus]|nr:hypothetical protein [Solidesulfovibrio magneticus]